jgi:ribosome biogenesis protein BRX1
MGGKRRNRSKSPAKAKDPKESSQAVAEEEEIPTKEAIVEAQDEKERSQAVGEEEEIPSKKADAEPEEETPKFISDGKYKNKQRCLVLCLRGATARYRHLLEDIRTLLPHHKKESKLDPGKGGMARAVNDIAEIRSCNTVLYLECRKHQDAYMWMGRTGENPGPSAKFHVSNCHTMDELRLTGNCMKGSRPILTFDESFKRLDHLKLLKELFVDIFGTPRGHPKSKPFVDRVMSFYYADNKVRSHLLFTLILAQVYDYINDERMSDLRE